MFRLFSLDFCRSNKFPCLLQIIAQKRKHLLVVKYETLHVCKRADFCHIPGNEIRLSSLISLIKYFTKASTENWVFCLTKESPKPRLKLQWDNILFQSLGNNLAAGKCFLKTRYPEVWNSNLSTTKPKRYNLELLCIFEQGSNTLSEQFQQRITLNFWCWR